MAKVEMRSYFSGRARVQKSFKGRGRTHQEFKDECDINSILKKYTKTGLLPHLVKSEPKYGDFSSALSYKESLELVLFAQEQFAALPAETRARFQNDPVQFLAFAEDPKNGAELIKMGLATAAESAKASPPSQPAPSAPKGKQKGQATPPAGDGEEA